VRASKSRADSASTATKGRENGPKLLQNIAEMDRQPRSAIYKFGPFALDIEAGVLLRGVEPILLGQRAIALLRLLLDRAASPVSKDALI
jgi:DNA-binding response OmpR family regulator